MDEIKRRPYLLSGEHSKYINALGLIIMIRKDHLVYITYGGYIYIKINDRDNTTKPIELYKAES